MGIREFRTKKTHQAICRVVTRPAARNQQKHPTCPSPDSPFRLQGNFNNFRKCSRVWAIGLIFPKFSPDSRLFSEAPRVDCAPPSHSSLDATLWRALEACSAHVARVDRGRPCAMQSYAVGCVHRRHLLHRPPRPDPGRTFFTPVAFTNVSRSDGGVSRPPGRAPCRLRTTRTDAPRPTRIP